VISWEALGIDATRVLNARAHAAAVQSVAKLEWRAIFVVLADRLGRRHYKNFKQLASVQIFEPRFCTRQASDECVSVVSLSTTAVGAMICVDANTIDRTRIVQVTRALAYTFDAGLCDWAVVVCRASNYAGKTELALQFLQLILTSYITKNI
jgi:hypothetical protein